MARTKFKCWLIFCYLIVSVSTRSLPLNRESIAITDSAYTTTDREPVGDAATITSEAIVAQEIKDDQNKTNRMETRNESGLNSVRPGQAVQSYDIILRREGDTIHGEAILDVRITDQTIENVMRFNMAGLEIHGVQVGLVTTANLQDADIGMFDNVLEVRPRQGPGATYMVIIKYSVPLRNDGTGIYVGKIDDEQEYLAMNLHPFNARRVFPCMDEPNLLTNALSFTFEDMDFNTVLTNSRVDESEDGGTKFIGLQGPVHRWAMVAHGLNTVNIPVPNLAFLYARAGTNNQETQASVAINNYYTALNEWTDVDHATMIADQNGGLHVVAVPDINRNWYGLSTLCIWEPFILMENNNAVKQRKTALVTIAEGMARQWFGWRIFPENWRDQWVITGLASYAAYEIVKDFQTSPPGQEDISLLDMDTIFTTDVIQESLLQDANDGSQPLRLRDTIYDEHDIRLHVNGLMKTKAAAILRMTKLLLSREADLVQTAAQGLLRSRASQAVNSRNFYDSLASGYGSGVGSGMIWSVIDFLTPWVENSGYPLITVTSRPDGITIMQERFGLAAVQNINYQIPLSFTTSVNPNFDDIFPSQILDQTSRPINLAYGDWIIFNIQGQGYYRVNYDGAIWEGIIGALADPETRETIHPLNRAALLDDALVLARAGRIDYDIPLGMALTMELETEYAVWKAFIRNMEFIRRRLEPFLEWADDRDHGIYLRMIRRVMEAFEEEIGFEPEGLEPAMVSLTRGMVMEHVCKVGYEPCVVVAVDMFYNPNDPEEVNPNIPPEIRPAVYCTMVREDEEGEVVEALKRHLDNVNSRYERLVILESFACSRDEGFVQSLLDETVSGESDYVLEERSRMFAAVASSSLQNSRLALRFLTTRTRDIRDMYGGPEKLEEAIFIMAENIVEGRQTDDFINWMRLLNSISNLDDSDKAAGIAAQRLGQNMQWVNNNLEDIYEWIDLNDGSTVLSSTLLLCASMLIALFNQH